jgi:hypothetical protein
VHRGAGLGAFLGSASEAGIKVLPLDPVQAEQLGEDPDGDPCINPHFSQLLILCYLFVVAGKLRDYAGDSFSLL